MNPEIRDAFGVLLSEVHRTSDAMDRRDAAGWLVVVVDLEAVNLREADGVVAAYGPFATPEEALVEAGRQEANQPALAIGEFGWVYLVKPLFTKEPS